MNNTSILKSNSIIKKIVLSIITVACAIMLPQIFHFIGSVSGVGSALGAALLPMQLPVILSGLLFGSSVGFMSGLLSPIISFTISGMPVQYLLSLMAIELSVYGLMSGLLSKSSINTILKILIIQLSGRVARIIATIVISYIFSGYVAPFETILSFIPAGLFGIILQLSIIPLLNEKLKELKLL